MAPSTAHPACSGWGWKALSDGLRVGCQGWPQVIAQRRRRRPLQVGVPGPSGWASPDRYPTRPPRRSHRPKAGHRNGPPLRAGPFSILNTMRAESFRVTFVGWEKPTGHRVPTPSAGPRPATRDGPRSGAMLNHAGEHARTTGSRGTTGALSRWLATRWNLARQSTSWINTEVGEVTDYLRGLPVGSLPGSSEGQGFPSL